MWTVFSLMVDRLVGCVQLRCVCQSLAACGVTEFFFFVVSPVCSGSSKGLEKEFEKRKLIRLLSFVHSGDTCWSEGSFIFD